MTIDELKQAHVNLLADTMSISDAITKLIRDTGKVVKLDSAVNRAELMIETLELIRSEVDAKLRKEIAEEVLKA